MAKLLKSLLLFTEWSLDRNHHTLHLRANRAAQQKGKNSQRLPSLIHEHQYLAWRRELKLKNARKIVELLIWVTFETWLVFEMQDGFCFKLFHPMDQSVWASRGPEASTCSSYIMATSPVKKSNYPSNVYLNTPELYQTDNYR
jgi:hypothetical protein